MKNRIRDAWEEGEILDTFPRFMEFLVDDEGGLWIQKLSKHHTLKEQAGDRDYRWGVGMTEIMMVDLQRREVREGTLPGRVYIREARHGRICALAVSDLDVESLSVYEAR